MEEEHGAWRVEHGAWSMALDREKNFLNFLKLFLNI